MERTKQGRTMKSEVIRLRLESDLLEVIRRQAEANERTIAKQIQFILKRTTQKGHAESVKGENK